MKRTLLFKEKNGGKAFFFKKNGISLISGFVLLIFLVASSETASAIPSYARQTGLSCSACHTVFPELTSFGRQFKLNGYTLTGIKTISQTKVMKENKKNTLVNLLSISPLSVMFKTGVTRLAKTIPGTQNNDVEFPQATSLYYGGQITPHLGAFIQVTMDGESGTFGMDMTDIRYANTTSIGKTPVLYGLTLNNGPMMQDVWNTASPWSFPYSSSGVAPTPTASTLIEGALAGSTMGVGAYGLLNNTLYLGFSIYRSAPFGATFPPNITSESTIKGVSPYWRLALQHQWDKSYLEVGTFGLSTDLYPTGITGKTNNYTDVGVDLQYDYSFGKKQITLHSSYIAEKQNLNAGYAIGDNQLLSNKLNTFKTDVSIFFRTGCKFTLGYFSNTGGDDNIIYQPEEIYGSRTGGPNSSGLMTQFDYLPWENTKISLIYTAYNKFNGASKNYDGFARNAADNNSIYIQFWFLF